MVLYIILGVVVVLIISYIAIYNGFVNVKNGIEEAYATIDVYLKKRFDLIPNLVETVKGYAKHESATLEQVTAARNSVAASSSTQERIESENILSGTLRSLFAVAEAYPDLKANVNFMDLQKQLQQVEMDLVNARKYYNANVKTFNIKLSSFPSNLVGKVHGFSRQPMFEVSNETERENVKVSF